MTTDFQDRIEDPHAWFIFAEIKFHAAEALWKISDVGRAFGSDVIAGRLSLEETGRVGGALQMSIPSLLLAGFGFESLLKAILLRQMYFRDEPLTQVGKKGQPFLVGSLKSHDLAALARQANVPLDAEETRLLERLTTIVTWAGRYPVSIGEDGLVPGAGEYGPAPDGKAVIALANKLFKFGDKAPQLIVLALAASESKWYGSAQENGAFSCYQAARCQKQQVQGLQTSMPSALSGLGSSIDYPRANLRGESD